MVNKLTGKKSQGTLSDASTIPAPDAQDHIALYKGGKVILPSAKWFSDADFPKSGNDLLLTLEDGQK